MRIAVLTLALLAADPAARAAGHALRLIDVPVPREGQWEKTSDEEGGVMHTYRLCEDGKRVAALRLGMECAGPNISHPASVATPSAIACGDSQTGPESGVAARVAVVTQAPQTDKQIKPSHSHERKKVPHPMSNAIK